MLVEWLESSWLDEKCHGPRLRARIYLMKLTCTQLFQTGATGRIEEYYHGKGASRRGSMEKNDELLCTKLMCVKQVHGSRQNSTH